jgi:ABC-type molybdate transport system substrate-binding protein
MNALNNNRSMKAILAVAFIFIGSIAFAGNKTEGNDTFKQSLKENLNTQVLKENRLEAAKVLVIFTVTEDSSLNILNAASLDQPIKEYVTKALNGKVTSDLEPGEAYQMMISFKRY